MSKKRLPAYQQEKLVRNFTPKTNKQQENLSFDQQIFNFYGTCL